MADRSPKRKFDGAVDGVRVEKRQRTTDLVVHPGWEQTLYRQYGVISKDKTIFWCSPDVLINNSDFFKKLLHDGTKIVIKKSEISLPIPTNYLECILNIFHNESLSSNKEIGLMDFIHILGHLVYLDAHPYIPQIKEKILNFVDVLIQGNFDDIPDILYQREDKFIRQFYRRTLKRYLPHIIERRDDAIKVINRRCVLTDVKNRSPRVIRYIAEEITNAYDDEF